MKFIRCNQRYSILYLKNPETLDENHKLTIYTKRLKKIREGSVDPWIARQITSYK